MTLGDLIEAIEQSGVPLDTQVGIVYGCNFPDDIEILTDQIGDGHPTMGGTFVTIGERTP